MRYRYFALIGLVILVLAAGCSKNDNTTSVSNSYAGSGSEGDVLTYTVNEDAGGYTIYNESTKRYENGSFTVYTNELGGLYKVFTGGSFYYAVEIHGRVFTGNFPTARLYNNLSYGTSAQSTSGNPMNFGNYVYLHISKSAINGSTLNREWGILTILANGTWMKQGYCNDTGSLPSLMPDAYTGSLPPANPSDSGTWSINPLFPNRMNMSLMHSFDSITGFPCASDSGAVFVMDLGYGHGFLVGLKLLEGSANPMKGNFGFADVRYDAGTGGGKIDINDTTHTVSWWRADSYAKVRNGTFGALNQCAVLKNVYFSKNVTFNGDTVDFYSVVSGPYFMEFQFRNNKFRSYGTGARLP